MDTRNLGLDLESCCPKETTNNNLPTLSRIFYTRRCQGTKITESLENDGSSQNRGGRLIADRLETQHSRSKDSLRFEINYNMHMKTVDPGPNFQDIFKELILRTEFNR